MKCPIVVGLMRVGGGKSMSEDSGESLLNWLLGENVDTFVCREVISDLARSSRVAGQKKHK